MCKQPNRLGNSTEVNSGEEFLARGVILLQLGIFEVFHCKSELQPGLLTIFWLFVDRPVSKSLQEFFSYVLFILFHFPTFSEPKLEKFKRGSSFAKMRSTLLDKNSKSY